MSKPLFFYLFASINVLFLMVRPEGVQETDLGAKIFDTASISNQSNDQLRCEFEAIVNSLDDQYLDTQFDHGYTFLWAAIVAGNWNAFEVLINRTTPKSLNLTFGGRELDFWFRGSRVSCFDVAYYWSRYRMLRELLKKALATSDTVQLVKFKCQSRSERQTSISELNEQDSDGNTLLHYAVQGNLPCLVRNLARAGANASIANNAGRTALSLVLEYASKETNDKNFFYWVCSIEKMVRKIKESHQNPAELSDYTQILNAINLVDEKTGLSVFQRVLLGLLDHEIFSTEPYLAKVAQGFTWLGINAASSGKLRGYTPLQIALSVSHGIGYRHGFETICALLYDARKTIKSEVFGCDFVFYEEVQNVERCLTRRDSVGADFAYILLAWILSEDEEFRQGNRTILESVIEAYDAAQENGLLKDWDKIKSTLSSKDLCEINDQYQKFGDFIATLIYNGLLRSDTSAAKVLLRLAVTKEDANIFEAVKKNLSSENLLSVCFLEKSEGFSLFDCALQRKSELIDSFFGIVHRAYQNNMAWNLIKDPELNKKVISSIFTEQTKKHKKVREFWQSLKEGFRPNFAQDLPEVIQIFEGVGWKKPAIVTALSIGVGLYLLFLLNKRINLLLNEQEFEQGFGAIDVALQDDTGAKTTFLTKLIGSSLVKKIGSKGVIAVCGFISGVAVSLFNRVKNYFQAHNITVQRDVSTPKGTLAQAKKLLGIPLIGDLITGVVAASLGYTATWALEGTGYAPWTPVEANWGGAALLGAHSATEDMLRLTSH